MKYYLKTLWILLFLGCSLLWAESESEKNFFENWPEGAEPAVVGEKVSAEWLTRPFQFEVKKRRGKVIYPEVCTWYGALEVARLTKNDVLTNGLVSRFDRFRAEDAGYISQKRHVDDTIFGVIPLELSLINNSKEDREMGLTFADRQWDNPDADGLSKECRFWVDDLYMLPILQVQAFRISGDKVYLDRTANTMVAYLQSLQQANGLFYHAPDSPFYWGRGNGWVAAGMAELLRELPADHAHYQEIVEGFHLMMTALVEYQSENGMWRQLLDDPESWVESSSTGMFTFAMITGVNLGLLDNQTFAPVARKGWLALVANINEESLIQNVCVGTNKGMKVVGEDLEKQRAFYLARPKVTGDLHGQAPILWSAAALLR